jgi:hypothetical protein
MRVRWMVPLLVLLLSCFVRALAARGGEGRALESKAISLFKRRPRFEFAMGARRIVVGHAKWKIPENSPGWNQMYGYGPVVWISEKGKTRVLDLRAELPSYFVDQVYDDPEAGRIYVFLDYGIEGPHPEYQVWTSADRGEHWTPAAPMPRPPAGEFPPSSLESFFLDADGKGVAFLKAEAGNVSAAKRGSISERADVYFRVTTADAGKTWHAEESPVFGTTLKTQKARTR